MKASSEPPKFLFRSKLERIVSEANYFAVSVPAKVSRELKTRGPVPVTARVNGSPAFLVSLFPVGGGRHYLRVKAEIREAAEIKGGDRVQVEITVRNRSDEISIPKDVARSLRADDVLEAFKALPIGKRSHLLRWIDEAAKPETREKRIEAVMKISHQKREKRK